jgi:branched-chain amino acid aminotransferase
MPKPSPPKRQADLIWFDGDFVAWEEANLHVLSHVVHYGSSVFEGIRCYTTPDGPKVFRLQDHVDRFYYSARVIRMEIPYRREELVNACLDVVVRNGFDACYIRPVAFRGAGGMGVFPKDCPLHIVIAAWEWGAYLGSEALDQGIDTMTSSWRKFPPGNIPTLAKIGGAYTLATLAKMEALRLGFGEALLLDTEGRVAEGTGENLFAVHEGRLITPPLSASILGGITRKSVLQLAQDHGIEVVEQSLTRDFLYMADELFFTGTAAEITPIRSVDGLAVGMGKRGPVTRKLQADFFDILNGRAPDRHGWLTLAVADTTEAPRA